MKTITPVTEKRSLATLCGRLVCPTDLTLASSAPNSATPTNVHSRSSWAAPRTNHAQKWKGIIDGYLNPFNSNEPAPKPRNQIGAPEKTLHYSTSLHSITTTTILDQEQPANPKLRGKWLISEQTVSQLVRILPVQFATTASTSSTSIGAGPIAEACILKPKVFKMDRLIWRRCCHNGGWGGWETREKHIDQKTSLYTFGAFKQMRALQFGWCDAAIVIASRNQGKTQSLRKSGSHGFTETLPPCHKSIWTTNPMSGQNNLAIFWPLQVGSGISGGLVASIYPSSFVAWYPSQGPPDAKCAQKHAQKKNNTQIVLPKIQAHPKYLCCMFF